MLRSLFRDLRAKGIVLTVITKGYVGAVRMLLQEEHLLDNFETVIGFTGREVFYLSAHAALGCSVLACLIEGALGYWPKSVIVHLLLEAILI